MIQRQDIKKWCETVAREFHPEQIILFGSYAQNTQTTDSDVDVLVIMPLGPGQRDVRQAAAIRDRVRAPFPMDVIVRSPRQIARRLASGDGFIAGIMRDGRLMYENKHTRLGGIRKYVHQSPDWSILINTVADSPKARRAGLFIVPNGLNSLAP